MGFTDLGVRRVFAHAMAANTASRRVMEKCGLTLVRTRAYEGHNADVIDGAEHGEVEYALTSEECGKLRQPATGRNLTRPDVVKGGL